MDNRERKELLLRLESQHKELRRCYEELESLTGCSTESPMFDAMFRILDSYMDALAVQIGCDPAELSWYVYDNEYGTNNKTVTLVNGEIVVCDNVDNFLKTI